MAVDTLVPMRWIGGIVAVLLALIMIGTVGLDAIQRRMITAPNVSLNFGSFHIRAFTTHTPNCRIPGTQPGNSFCSTNSIYSTDEYYVVWLLSQSRRGGVTFEEARRLALVRLRNDVK
ncbi:MAG: hypothetical protein ACUVSY_05860 [Roseiflexus sp.]